MQPENPDPVLNILRSAACLAQNASAILAGCGVRIIIPGNQDWNALHHNSFTFFQIFR